MLLTFFNFVFFFNCFSQVICFQALRKFERNYFFLHKLKAFAQTLETNKADFKYQTISCSLLANLSFIFKNASCKHILNFYDI